MRKAITLMAVALLSGSTTLTAQHRPLLQQRPSWSTDPDYEQALALAARLAAARGAAAKTNGTGARLTGIARFSDVGNGLQAADTFFFRYGGLRTSSFDERALNYNTEYDYNPVAPDNLVDYDSCFVNDLIGQSPQDVAYMERNADGRVTRFYRSGQRIDDYTYDAQGRPSALTRRQYSTQTAGWINTGKWTFCHDAPGNWTADTVYSWNSASGVWDLVGSHVRSYNTSRLPTQTMTYHWDGTAFNPLTRVSISYTAAGLPLVTKLDNWDGGGFVPRIHDSAAYGAGGALLYQITYCDLNGSGLVMISEQTRHLNAAHLPDSITVVQMADVSTHSYETYYMRMSWNSLGDPVTITSRRQGTPSPDLMTRYYYNAVSQRVAAAPVRKSLSVFPNPAGNRLSLRPDFSGPYRCRITNAAGQLLLSSTGTATSGETLSLPLGNLAPGRYWLQLQQGEAGLYSASFVRE